MDRSNEARLQSWLRSFSIFPRLSYSCVLLPLLVVELFLLHPSAAADRPVSQPPETFAEPPQTASVMLDGRALFRVRGVIAFPAEQRAGIIEERLAAIGSNETLSLDDLQVEEASDRSVIRVADEWVMAVFDADGQKEGTTRQLMAEVYRSRIKEALARYRHDRSAPLLLTHSIYAAGATAAFALTVYVLIVVLRRFDRFLEQRYKAKVEGLRTKTFNIVETKRLWDGVRASQRLLRTGLVLVLLIAYGEFVLGLFPWTRALSQQLLSLALDPLRTMGLAFIHAVPSLIFLIVLAVITRYSLKLLKLYFTGLQIGTIQIKGFDPDWAMPTYRLLRILTIAFALVIAYPHVPGSHSEAFKGISILAGVIFSLGSSSSVANIIAGYTMIYRRAFKVGDRIKIENVVGDVTEMRLQVTHLRSLKNEEVTIPNSTILNSSVTNFSRHAREQGLMLHTTVGIGYETSWRQVEAMLLEAAQRTAGVLRNPPPFVLLLSLGDFAVTYELNVYCDQPQQSLHLYAALHRNILDLFNEHGVQIMTPAYEGDPATPKIVPKDQWFAPPAKASASDPPSAP